MKTGVILAFMETWFDNGFRGFDEPARIADDLGVDLLTFPEHLAMTNNIEQFERRYGQASVNPFTPFSEPMVHLGALSAVTRRIKLGTTIMLSPLRTSLAMAKQIATLDDLSDGRAWIGLGAGWQKEEFDATGMPWKGRYDLLFEQVDLFRKLWSEAPASHHGDYVRFDNLNCLPFPPQGKDIPIVFGIKGTDKNLRRIAEAGGGWIPMDRDPEVLAAPIAALQAEWRACGRDVADLEVTAFAQVYPGENGLCDIDRTLELVPRYAEIGVTTLIFAPPAHIAGFDGFARLVERIERSVKG